MQANGTQANAAQADAAQPDAAQASPRAARRISTGRVLPIILLVGLFVMAAVLRFTDINWDQFQHLHPDERFIVWVADTIKWPAGVEGGLGAQLSAALDPARSPLNPLRWPPDGSDLAGKPRNFAYGHFPLYLLVGVSHAAASVGDWFGHTTLIFPAWMQKINTVGRHLAEYNYLALAGRAISAVADLGTLLLVYAMGCRVGRRLFPFAETGILEETWFLRTGAGLLAAGFYAFAVLPVQLSHFAAVDALLTFLVVATVALAARYAEQGGRWTWAFAGILAGLAVGSKFSAVMLALPLVAAALFRLPPGPWTRKALVVLRRVVPVAALALLTFVVTNPFAVLELPAYIGQITAQNQMVSGVMDAPYTRQYIGTVPYWYFVQQLSQWGLGWPAGIIAWAGLLWALARFGLGRASAAMTVMLAWAFPYFVVTGGFHTKFLRYMAPLLPFLLVFGAAMAVSGYRWMAGRWGRAGRMAWGFAAFVTASVTIAWSVAFMGMYGQEHPWLQASNWIYRNIPEGSKILSEEWDDALPLTMDELTNRPPLRKYEGFELPVWDADSNDKVEALAGELAGADYLAIASNRVYAPVGRLAGRYPMTSQYYRKLFAGELGYELVADFYAYPRLGNWIIRDDHADESLSVYDHPHAFVFRNTGRLTKDQIALQLRRYLPPGGARVPAAKAPGHASIRAQDAGPDQPLTLAQPVNTLPDVTDYRWNATVSGSTILSVLLWWFVITLFGWFAWPLLFPLARGLADRGHAISRVFGWLLLGWVHWIGVSLGLWHNALGPLLLILLILVLLGRWAWSRQREAMGEYLARRLRLIAGQELLFALAFLFFVLIRLLNPDLWQPWNGGEKFMEFAFLNATLRSPVFPPYDPYFAGGILNYYYFGLYLVGIPIRLTGIFAEVAFNLAVPSLFALTALGAFSVTYSIADAARCRAKPAAASGDDGVPPTSTAAAGGGRTRAVRPGVAGALAVVLTLLIGNLTGLEWAFGALAQFLTGKGFPAFDYWAASRVVPFTINEFPLWTFTFADLHPHLISMAFGMLVAALALNWLRCGAGSLRQALVRLLVLSLSLGALGAINTWDLPTYALLVGGALLAAAWRTATRGGDRLLHLAAAALSALGVVALSIALYLPFYQNYQAQVGGGEGGVVSRFLGVVKDSSPFKPWLLIWGFFLFLALSYTLVELLGRRMASEMRRPAETGLQESAETAEAPADVAPPRPRPGRGWLFAVLLLFAAAAIFAAAGRPTVAAAALPLILAMPLVLDRRSGAGPVFVGLLLVLGFGVIAGIELVYLRDFLEGGDWYRMNTLFKFSVPAWLFLGLASGYMLPRLWLLGERGPAWLGAPWQVAAALLLAGSLVFLFVGVKARVDDRFPGARPPVGTLDGMAYMRAGQYGWPAGDNQIRLAEDYDAIKWLLANVKGTPVVAEAPAGGYTVNGEAVNYDYYRAGGLRVASMTGLPTFVGQHQYEQRPGDQVSAQTAKGMEFFQTTNRDVVRRLIDELHVGYIYVGPLERLLFGAEQLGKFDSMVGAGELGIAYRNPGVVIYEVPTKPAN